MIRSFPAAAAALILLALLNSPNAMAEDGESVSLFNGKDLSGWIGREDLWKVEDGQIVGTTTAENPLKQNTFLIYTGSEPADFRVDASIQDREHQFGDPIPQQDYRQGKIRRRWLPSRHRLFQSFRGHPVRGTRPGHSGRTRRFGDPSFEKGEKVRKRFADGRKLGSREFIQESGMITESWPRETTLQHFINGAMTAEVFDNQPEKASRLPVSLRSSFIAVIRWWCGSRISCCIRIEVANEGTSLPRSLPRRLSFPEENLMAEPIWASDDQTETLLCAARGWGRRRGQSVDGKTSHVRFVASSNCGLTEKSSGASTSAMWSRM